MPEISSMITSRADVTTTDEFGKSPFWVAPMDTVVDATNYNWFLEQNINTILPRKEWKKIEFIPYSSNFWIALTLDEAFELYTESQLHDSIFQLKEFVGKMIKTNGTAKILIDVANGHMERLYTIGAKLKNKYGDKISLMGGNIANPDSIVLADGIFDYIKIGIGGGSRCLTSTKTGIHYPLGSLIMDTLKVIKKKKLNVRLIADGGISSIGDAIKAIALGADVMMGKMFNGTIEASTITRIIKNDYVNDWDGDKSDLISLFRATREKQIFQNLYRGMSTIEVQKKEEKTVIKPAEGFTDWNLVTHTVEELTNELNFALSSSMSYCGCFELDEYKSKKHKWVRLI